MLDKHLIAITRPQAEEENIIHILQNAETDATDSDKIHICYSKNPYDYLHTDLFILFNNNRE